MYQILGLGLGILTSYILGFRIPALIVSAIVVLFSPILLKRRSPKPGTTRDCKVCVVICAHNEEKTVERSLRSALNQTYENLEVVVVDDASTDNTSEILKSWEERFSDRLIVLRNEKNIGKFRSMLRAFDETDCDVYLFIDADNEIPRDYIEYYVRFTKEYDMMETPISAYNASETFTSSLHTAELLLFSFIRLFNLFPSFTGRSSFLKRDVLDFIKRKGIFGIDDGAVMNAAAEIGNFRYAFPTGPALREMPTYEFKDFVRQRDRWYTLGIYGASRNGAKGVLTAFGFNVGFILGGAVLTFLGGFHAFPPVFVASSAAIVGAMSSKLWKTDISPWIAGVVSAVLVFLNTFLVTVSLLKSTFGLIPKSWYRISKERSGG